MQSEVLSFIGPGSRQASRAPREVDEGSSVVGGHTGTSTSLQVAFRSYCSLAKVRARFIWWVLTRTEEPTIDAISAADDWVWPGRQHSTPRQLSLVPSECVFLYRSPWATPTLRSLFTATSPLVSASENQYPARQLFPATNGWVFVCTYAPVICCERTNLYTRLPWGRSACVRAPTGAWLPKEQPTPADPRLPRHQLVTC